VWADSAVAVDPNYILAWSTTGAVAIERADYTRAIAAFDAQRRLSSDVEVVNALAGRALAEARAGRRDEARATLRQAESLVTAYTPTPLHTVVYLAEAYAGWETRTTPWPGLLGLILRNTSTSNFTCAAIRHSIPSRRPRFKGLAASRRARPEKGC
jgi:tetratricopeptide (TPR) repeat protein